MSYSLNDKCGTCTKKNRCTDKHFLYGAICGIHNVFPSEKGHLGSGTVTLDCQNHEEEKLTE